MVQYYKVAGANVGSHYLAMGVLAAIFSGSAVMMRGGNKAAPKAPPLNATSSDEADFIKKFMEEAEAEEKSKTKH